MIGLYILCLILMCFMVVFLFIRLHFNKAGYNHGLKRDVMIVLGYPAKKDGSMSPILRERINKAADLYHAGIAEIVICSGAAVANNHVEADVMARALVKLGVDCSQIIRETKAKNTYENLIKSRKIMHERGLKKVVIVTSPWHLRKASSYAFRLEIEHTLENSKVPKEFFIGVGFIYVYVYIQMFIIYLRFYKGRQ
ncbi:YdcF family protein [Gracilibacillus saliphilus]|uniref:YdcF family protein n=1 Tax=Gracilibacillus saliphilus TaxID=543890 RepID=UPI0013D53672|nr:YdcF family protein [Gracilibacillus saliphilus]